MDLLRKSRVKSEFDVVNASDEVKPETEAFPATPITLCEDSPYFEPTDDALDVETKTGQGAVGLLFLVAQRVLQLVAKAVKV